MYQHDYFTANVVSEIGKANAPTEYSAQNILHFKIKHNFFITIVFIAEF